MSNAVVRASVCAAVFVALFASAHSALRVQRIQAAEQAPIGPTRLLRYADISKDKVVFSYAGDLWTASREGGPAHRLTSGPGDKLYPKFSPDAKWIAFTAEYDGNPDVYIIPVDGGEPKRLTFH